MAKQKGSAASPARVARDVQARLRKMGDPGAAEGARRFFKPAEAVRFYGVRTAVVRKLVSATFASVRGRWRLGDALACCDLLIRDPHLETKIVGVELLGRYHRQFDPKLLPRVERWLSRGYCSNWATVDDLAPRVLTPLLAAFPDLVVDELRRWTASPNLWLRRAAIVTLVKPARRGEHLATAYDFATRMLGDREDLMHKATGWLLREAGRTNPVRLERYLLQQGKRVPRTTVRYAIEKFPEAVRLRVLRETRGRA